MLRVNLNCYGSYTTDSVYQWDQNHVLTLTGNNIGDISAIHFCNKKCDNARVVNVVRGSGEISAPIPNELLEMPYDVIAYVHTIDDNQAKTIEVVNIPVIKRVKPDDYEFVENVDIVNFERLEKDIQDFIANMTNEYNSFTNLVNNQQENFINGFTDEYNSRVASGYFLGPEGATEILNRLDDVDAISEANGSPILVIDSAKSELIDMSIYGNSTQDGEPTPENPINKTSVAEEGTLKVKSIGKNLLPYPYDYDTTTKNGITFTKLKDGSIMANGTNNTESNADFHYKAYNDELYGLFLSLVKNEKYILSGCPSGGSKAGYNLNICFRNGSTAVSSRMYDLGDGLEFETKYDADRFQVVIYIAPGVTVNNLIFKPMIRRAEVIDDTHESYKESSASIELQEPLRSIGDIKDEIACIDGVYGVIRRIKSVNLRELTRLNFGITENYTDVIYSVPDINTSDYGAMCTHFTYTSDWEYVPGKFTNNANEKQINLWYPTYITDEDTLADWLSYNDVILDYVSAEEVVTPFENQDVFNQLETYDGVTHFNVTDNAPMRVQYYRNSDIGKQLVKMKTEHEQLENQIMELEALNNDTGWVLLTNTSTDDYIYSNNSGIYYRLKNGVLYLRGMIDTVKKAGLIATLPTGFRPGITINFPVIGDIFGNTDKQYNGYLNGSVDVNGNIRVVDNYGALTRIDAVTFNVAIPL